MLQTVAPFITLDPASSAPVEVTVTVTPEARLNAYMIGRAERERRSRTATVRTMAGLLQPATSPQASVLLASLVVAVLILHHLRPDIIPPRHVWLLTWAPMVVGTTAYWAALPLLQWMVRSSMGKSLHPSLRPGTAAEEMHLRLSPGEVEAAWPSRRLQALRDPVHTVVETLDAFTIVLEEAVIPVPKAGLNGQAIASLRTTLGSWQLREAPTRPSLVLPLLGAVLLVGGFWLPPRLQAQASQQAGALAAAAQSTPGQASIRLTDRFMRLDGSRTSIEEENYRVWMLGGQMYDQLRGAIKHRAAEGRFWLGRHAPGNIARTPGDELRNLQQTAAGNESIPDDAAVTALPDSGVLVTWPDKQGNGSCAALRSYRDQVPAEALPAGTTLPHYRRNLLLRFCTPAMSPAMLGDWLIAATPAFYAEFNAAVRP